MALYLVTLRHKAVLYVAWDATLDCFFIRPGAVIYVLTLKYNYFSLTDFRKYYPPL